MNDERVRSQIKLWHILAVEHLGGKCAICNSQENLEIHHNDSVWKNNDTSNLKLLCRNCHKKTFINNNPNSGRRIRFNDPKDTYHVRTREMQAKWRAKQKEAKRLIGC